MLTRRGFGTCAICTALGLVATKADAQTQGVQTSGTTRTILQRSEFPGEKYATILVTAEIAPKAKVARHTHPGVESALDACQAKASGAKVLGLANAGLNAANCVKQAHEFGFPQSGMQIAQLLIFDTCLHAIGIAIAQGGVHHCAPLQLSQRPEQLAYQLRQAVPCRPACRDFDH